MACDVLLPLLSLSFPTYKVVTDLARQPGILVGVAGSLVLLGRPLWGTGRERRETCFPNL